MSRPRGFPSYPGTAHQSGQARVVIGGRCVYLGKFGSPASHEAYARLKAEWVAGGGVAPPTAKATLTVADLTLQFFRHVETHHVRPDGSQTTEVGEYRLVLRLLRDHYGSTAAANFGPLQLKAIRQKMIDLDLSRRTVNARTSKVIRCFSWGVENGLVPGAVTHALREVRQLPDSFRCPCPRGRGVEPVPAAHVEAILPELTSVLRAIVLFLRHTGARCGEACLLRTCDLRTDRPIWEYRPTHHKLSYLGRERIVYIGPKAQEVLRPWLRLDEPERFLFSPKDSWEEGTGARRKPRGGRGGDHYASRHVNDAVARACRRAGIPHFHTHQIRHLAATEINRQAGMAAAKTLLGHSDLKTTASYTAPDLDAAREAIRQCG